MSHMSKLNTTEMIINKRNLMTKNKLYKYCAIYNK